MPITSTRDSRSQGEDVDVIVSGFVGEEEVVEAVVFDPKNYLPCTTARMMGATFSLQPGVEALLYWEGEDEHNFMLPLDGKGCLDFTPFGGMMNPKIDGWTGKILLRVSTNVGGGHFALALHLTKQRS